MMDPKQRADELMRRMTLEEKAAQMIQIPANSIPTRKRRYGRRAAREAFCTRWASGRRTLQKVAMESRLGIPVLFGIDAVRGHALEKRRDGVPLAAGDGLHVGPGGARSRGPRHRRGGCRRRPALDVRAAVFASRATCAGGGWTKPSANRHC